MAGRAHTDKTRQRARDVFLAELAARGNVTDAAEAAGIGRATAYQWRDDPEFAAAWADAIERAADRLEAEAWRRAVEGVQEPIIGRVERDRDGIVTDDAGNALYIRKYSDTLMTLLLKAHKPDKYRESVSHEHRGSIAVEFINDWRTSDP